MFVDSIAVTDWDGGSWPFTVPAIRTVAEQGLHFETSVTFLVGENGSGKSTLIEAIAQALGIDNRGGHGGRKYGTTDTPNLLGTKLFLRPPLGNRRRINSFFLRAETALGVLEYMSDYQVPGYGDRHLGEVSHGESFLQVLEGRFDRPGIYLLDEPESALSFRSCLALMATLSDLAKVGSQIICSTHSPLVTALPAATILQLSETGIAKKEWHELELVSRWTEFLQEPGRYLKYLLE